MSDNKRVQLESVHLARESLVRSSSQMHLERETFVCIAPLDYLTIKKVVNKML